MKLAIKQLSGC